MLLHQPWERIMNQASTPATAIRLASKARIDNPNHHLTDNNGTWWCQITIHRGPFSKRLRFSLETRDLATARKRRDRVFSSLSARSSAPPQKCPTPAGNLNPTP